MQGARAWSDWSVYSGGPRWHQDKEAHGLSSALVNSNNLLCLLTPLSPTYSRLVFKKY